MLWFMSTDRKLRKGIKKINKDRKAYFKHCDEIINGANDFAEQMMKKHDELIDAIRNEVKVDKEFDKVYRKYADVKGFEAENIRPENADDYEDEYDFEDVDEEDDDEDDEEDCDDEVFDVEPMTGEEFRRAFFDEVERDSEDADDEDDEEEEEETDDDEEVVEDEEEPVKEEPKKSKVNVKDVYVNNRKSAERIMPENIKKAGYVIKDIVLNDTEFGKIDSILTNSGYNKTMETDDHTVGIYEISRNSHIEVTKMPASDSYVLSVCFNTLFRPHGDAHLKYAKAIFNDGHLELVSSETCNENVMKGYGYNEDYLVTVITTAAPRNNKVEIMFCKADDDGDNE